MAKYGDLIRRAREAENQEANEPDNQLSGKPDNQVANQLDNLGEVANRKHLSENQLSGKPDNQTTKQPEREVNLCVKVPESLRRHWAAEAKRQGITMTEVMTEALTQKFGKPSS
jgi:predicted HicB family RNase H-like nuclease